MAAVSGLPRNFVQRWFNKFSLGQRERGSEGGSTLLRRSGGSCKLVQEISFHIVKLSNFWYFKTFYDDNQFICHCKCKTIANLGKVKQSRYRPGVAQRVPGS